MPQTILSTKKLSKTFSAGGVQQHVLKNLDIEIYDGDFTVIMGPSGAGKSTLLYALSGMDKPTLGQIYFGDNEISKLTNDQLAVFRRKSCGFVFQQNYLMDNMSIMDNILVAGLLVNKNKKELTERARKLFLQMGINEELWKKFPNQLSGGEAQRAGVARALISKPQIVFADEPTGSLNSASGIAVLDALTAVNNEGQSVVMVTHDLKSARRGGRIVYLRDGVICGECILGAYVDEGIAHSQDNRQNSQDRQQKLNEFLTEMGW